MTAWRSRSYRDDDMETRAAVSLTATVATVVLFLTNGCACQPHSKEHHDSSNEVGTRRGHFTHRRTALEIRKQQSTGEVRFFPFLAGCIK